MTGIYCVVPCVPLPNDLWPFSVVSWAFQFLYAFSPIQGNNLTRLQPGSYHWVLAHHFSGTFHRLLVNCTVVFVGVFQLVPKATENFVHRLKESEIFVILNRFFIAKFCPTFFTRCYRTSFAVLFRQSSFLFALFAFENFFIKLNKCSRRTIAH